MPRLKAAAWPPACFAGYAALAALVFHAGLAPGHIIGDGGDGRQMAWFLAWDRFALAGHHLLLTDWIDYPLVVNLTWNTTVPALGVALAPVTALAGPVSAYNVGLVASVALAGLTAQLFAQRVLGGGAGAVIAGAIYGFSPYMIAHSLGHLNTILWTPPLVALILHSALTGRAHPVLVGCLLGLVAAIQAWIGEEFVLTTAIAAGIALGVLAWVARADLHRAGLRRLGITLAVAVPVLLASAGWLLWVQFLGPNPVLHRPDNDVFGNDLLGPILPNGLQLIAFGTDVSHRFPLAISEQNAYLGIPLLALWAWVAVTRWSKLVAWATGLGAALLLLSFGPRLYLAGVPLHLPFLWRPFLAVPIFDNVLPSRLMAFAYIPVGLVCGWYFGVAGWAGRLAVVVALLPLVPTPSFPSAQPAVPAYFTAAGAPSGVVLILPYSAEGDATAMLWQAESGMRFKMPEGYARVPGPDGRALQKPPPSPLAEAMLELKYGRRAGEVDVSPQAVLDQLHRLGVGEVVLGPCPEQAEATTYFDRLLGDGPVAEGGVLVWRL